MGTVFGEQFAAGDVRRATKRLVQDAAGGRRTVKRGGRALQDIERLECVEIDARRRNRGGRRNGKAIDILLRREAAYGDEIVARVRPVILAEHAGGVAHGLLGIDEVQQIDLITRDDGDRLRSLDQRNIGLVRGDRAFRNETPGGNDDRAILGASGLQGGALRGVPRLRGLPILGMHRHDRHGRRQRRQGNPRPQADTVLHRQSPFCDCIAPAMLPDLDRPPAIFLFMVPASTRGPVPANIQFL